MIPAGCPILPRFWAGWETAKTSPVPAFVLDKTGLDNAEARTPASIPEAHLPKTGQNSAPNDVVASRRPKDGLPANAGGQLVQNLHFDGKDYPGSGPGAPKGYVSSGHRINDHAVDRIDKINGKTLYNQQIEVSADGKALKVTIHIPGRDKPDWMVFDRE